jgi:hypothetical protein
MWSVRVLMASVWGGLEHGATFAFEVPIYQGKQESREKLRRSPCQPSRPGGIVITSATAATTAAKHTRENQMSTTAVATVKSASAKKASKKAPANKKFGSQRDNVRRKVIRMREQDLMSWASIGEELGLAPRTVRRLYQEKVGKGAHHGLLPGKGGQMPWTRCGDHCCVQPL